MAAIKINMKRRKPKVVLSPEEAKRRRQEYQRQYYLTHREKAKEYQRAYNATNKKSTTREPGARGANQIVAERPGVRKEFTHHDLMHAPASKTLKMLNGILSGEKMFVGVR